MNEKALKIAEQKFLSQYPGGFNHPDIIAIGKKHKMDKMVAYAKESFAKKNFKEPEQIIESYVKVVSRSSMVSLFEKPKFRDFAYALSLPDQEKLVKGLEGFLHKGSQKGFEQMVDVLKVGKLAKWSLMTVVPAYYAPTEEVFVKPTTAKGVVKEFELDGLVYHPTPSWDFYQGYKDAINTMKTQVDPTLSPSNPAFSGFLMMTCFGDGPGR